MEIMWSGEEPSSDEKEKCITWGGGSHHAYDGQGASRSNEKIEVPGAIVESAAEEQKAEISENKAELTTESLLPWKHG